MFLGVQGEGCPESWSGLIPALPACASASDRPADSGRSELLPDWGQSPGRLIPMPAGSPPLSLLLSVFLSKPGTYSPSLTPYSGVGRPPGKGLW